MTQLRCWPGCVARIITPGSPNRDRIVTCVRLLDPGEELEIDGRWRCEAAPSYWGPQWHVRGWLHACSPDGSDVLVPEAAVSDRQLQPLGDPDEGARDETLDWLPVPGAEVSACAQS